LPKKRRRILQPHEIKPMVGKSTTAMLLGSLAKRSTTSRPTANPTDTQTRSQFGVLEALTGTVLINDKPHTTKLL
jgi:hypothetical protein